MSFSMPIFDGLTEVCYTYVNQKEREVNSMLYDVVTAKPIPLAELVFITNNKPIELGDKKCRVMNFSEGQ